MKKNKHEKLSPRDHQPQHYHPDALLRLPQVTNLIPVSTSTWWAGVKSGRFPKPVKLGPRTTAWRYRDLKPICDSGLSQHETIDEKESPPTQGQPVGDGMKGSLLID